MIFRIEVGPSPSELWWTPAGRRPNALPICRISGWPRAANAISSVGHLRTPAKCMFHGKVRARWRHSTGPALLWSELPESCKIAGKAHSSLTPPEIATRSERFLNFDRGPTGPCKSLRILPGLLLPTLSNASVTFRKSR